MEFLKQTNYNYLGVGIETNSKQYQNGVADHIAKYSPARIGTLSAFLVLCVLLYFGFYNPMCWQLDAEQKRTSAMLLLIPTDIMERVPTIREFVQKLEG